MHPEILPAVRIDCLRPVLHDGAMVAVLRPGVPEDGPFLAEMVVAAVHWRPGEPAGSITEVLGQPAFAHYVTGWPRPGDLAVIAEDGGPVGAAWLRYFPDSDPGFGFVTAQTPELSIGVVQHRRSRGVGSALLTGVLAAAKDAGVAAVSLSVERDNPARNLYGRYGFRPVGQRDGSVTMLLRLGEQPVGPVAY